ncbi:hypothetical protein Cgig2_012397 [Carnegiea gigantea]|uniref:GDSL esterase/lipase EXL3 n=1 Tax=Carnegiea gigantea TaxID=171969 RepID=A0A9Q1JTE3_9CARY|nr:hypothetical protein Cgig2_012397 [Carnegiea gigantea]
MHTSSFSSSSSSSRIRLQCLLFSLLLAVMTTGAIPLPPNVTVTAVIGFGDSIIDPGNNNGIKTIIKCNHPPYGKDFMGGIPTGRFSNGRIPTDLIAEEVSVKQYVPAYLDPTVGPQDLLTGVSFASGASGYDPLTSTVASVIPLSQQLDYFKEYIQKVTHLVGEERTMYILKNAVFLVVAGSDDIANTYFDTPFRKNYDPNSYTDLMLHSASAFVQDLYNLGARRLAVFGAPPIGCVPSQRTLAGGIVRACAGKYNEVAQLFNSKLSAELNKLHRKNANSRIVYIDIYSALDELITNPAKYGFEEVTKGCCGTGLIEVTSLLCNKLDPVCPDASKYVFWDSYHPTEKGYQALVSMLLRRYMNQIL